MNIRKLLSITPRNKLGQVIQPDYRCSPQVVCFWSQPPCRQTIILGSNARTSASSETPEKIAVWRLLTSNTRPSVTDSGNSGTHAPPEQRGRRNEIQADLIIIGEGDVRRPLYPPVLQYSHRSNLGNNMNARALCVNILSLSLSPLASLYVSTSERLKKMAAPDME